MGHVAGDGIVRLRQAVSDSRKVPRITSRSRTRRHASDAYSLRGYNPCSMILVYSECVHVHGYPEYEGCESVLVRE